MLVFDAVCFLVISLEGYRASLRFVGSGHVLKRPSPALIFLQSFLKGSGRPKSDRVGRLVLELLKTQTPDCER